MPDPAPGIVRICITKFAIVTEPWLTRFVPAAAPAIRNNCATALNRFYRRQILHPIVEMEAVVEVATVTEVVLEAEAEVEAETEAEAVMPILNRHPKPWVQVCPIMKADINVIWHPI